MNHARSIAVGLLALVCLLLPANRAWSQEKPSTPDSAAIAELKKDVAAAADKGTDGVRRGDTAWMLASSGLVMLMVPGLALFYGGMVRRKNVLATMKIGRASCRERGSIEV